jgi:hypothetical protein
MDNAALTTDAHVLAVVAGVIFGSAAVSSACWVWLRKQIFAYGGSALCGAGVVLLGLSIWHSVEFGVTGSGMSLKLQAAELEKKLETVSSEIASVSASSTLVEHRLADLNSQSAALEKATSDARAYADLAARAAASTSAVEHHLADFSSQSAAVEKATSDARAYADLAARAAASTSAIATATAETGRQIVALTDLRAGTHDVGKAAEKATQDAGKALGKAVHDTGVAVEKAAPLRFDCRNMGFDC